MFHVTQLQSRTQTYVLDELIDKTSAYSVVYKAHLQHSQEVVVVKLSKKQRSGVWNEVFDEGFDSEQSLLEKLIHPHIIRLHDAGQDYGRKFLVLEYGGHSLKALQDTRQPPWKEDGTLTFYDAAQIACQALSALEYIHLQGIAHRDIYTSNIVLQQNRAKIIDFNHRAGPASEKEQQQDIQDIGRVIHSLLTNKSIYDLKTIAPLFHVLFDEQFFRFRREYTAHELAEVLKRMM